MEIVGLVPLGDDIGTRLGALFDDDTGIGAVIGVDIEHQLALGTGEQRSDIGDTLLGVALGDQHLEGSAGPFGELLATPCKGGMIGIGKTPHGNCASPLITSGKARRQCGQSAGCSGGLEKAAAARKQLAT